MHILLRPWIADCEETGALLSDHVDGELHGHRQRRVLRHLARCERCRSLLDRFTRVIGGLRSLGEAPGDQDGAADAVTRRIRAEGIR